MSNGPESQANQIRAFAAAPAPIKPPKLPPPVKKKPPRIRVENPKGLRPLSPPAAEPARLQITQEELRMIESYRAPRRWKALSTEELSSYRLYPGATS